MKKIKKWFKKWWYEKSISRMIMSRITQIIGGVLFAILIVAAISVGYFNINYIDSWSDTVGIIIVPSSVIVFLLLLLLSFKLVLPEEFFY